MSKIRLLILLLISFVFFGCSSNNQLSNKMGLSVAYIGGEYDGLVLSNKLSLEIKDLERRITIAHAKIIDQFKLNDDVLIGFHV